LTPSSCCVPSRSFVRTFVTKDDMQWY
jgi:hypothetical protein